MAAMGYILILILLPVFVFGRVKENMIVLKVAKFVNIGIGIISFMDAFINDMVFSSS